MNLSKASEVIPSKIFDASSIDNPRCNNTGLDEVFEPVGGVLVDLVVESIGGHAAPALKYAMKASLDGGQP